MRRLLLLLAVLACGGDENTEPTAPVATVTVSPATATIAPGAVLQLQATTQDAGGATLTGRQIDWTTSDAAVATVSPIGTVTGIADGNVTVTATSEGKNGSAAVTVRAPVASVSVEPDATVIAGETVQLIAVTRDAPGNVLTGRTVTWASSEASVATISTDGLVRGVSPGSAQITATSEGATGAATITVALDFAEISAGNVRTCGITSFGAGFCWGLNNAGQLGDGTAATSTAPEAVLGGLTFQTVVAGGEGTHTCGITKGGPAYCWGNNNVGQLGDGTTTSKSVPATVAGGLTFVSLAVHATHTCGITDGGLAYCWGFNDDGELGTGNTSSSNVPVAVASEETFTAIAVGYHHTCALAVGGAAYCWGANFNGLLGDGTSNPSTTPVAVAGEHSFTRLTTGSFHTCALTLEGAAYCWGFNALGDGTENPSSIPVAVAGGHVFATLSAGFANTCGVTVAGEGYCWGDNGSGQVGTGVSGNAVLVPAAVVGGLQFTQIIAGALHTCGVTTDREAHCWGINGQGQLGDGSTAPSTVPIKVAGQS